MVKKLTLPAMLLLVVFLLVGCTGSDTTVSEDNNSGTDSDTVSEKEETEEVTYMDVVIADFIKEYDENQISAEKKYTGTYIKTSGYIDNISEDILGDIFVSINPDDDEFYFGTTLQCFPENEDDVLELTNGSPITIGGKVKDQELGIVIIKECKIL